MLQARRSFYLNERECDRPTDATSYLVRAGSRLAISDKSFSGKLSPDMDITVEMRKRTTRRRDTPEGAAFSIHSLHDHDDLDAPHVPC